jgi:hypothetical protein
LRALRAHRSGWLVASGTALGMGVGVFPGPERLSNRHDVEKRTGAPALFDVMAL